MLASAHPRIRPFLQLFNGARMLKNGMTPDAERHSIMICEILRCTHTTHTPRRMHSLTRQKKSLSTPSPDPQSKVVRPSQKTDRPSPTKLTFSLSFVPQSYLFLHLFSRAQVVSELDGYSNSRYKNKSHTTWENQDTLGIATPNGRGGEHSLLSPSLREEGRKCEQFLPLLLSISPSHSLRRKTLPFC